MARRRFFPTPVRSTRAQSVARSTFAPTYVPPPVPRKRAFDDEYMYTHRPFRPFISHSTYDTSGHENFTRSEINRELLVTSAAMEDNYDIVNMSRNKDKDVLNRAQRAITTVDQNPRSTGGTRQARGRSSLRRSQLFSHTPSVNVPSKKTYKTTTTVVPLNLSSPERSSPFLSQADRLHTNTTLREGSYQPLYSRSVRTSVSPERPPSYFTSFSPERSPSYFRSMSRSVSPYRSPSRDSSPLPVEASSLSRRASRPVRKRPRPRVLASKRKVGNYYDRLLSRRATQPSGAEGKYWPYIDVEDIENTYTGDLFSDTESLASGADTYIIESKSNLNDFQPSYSYTYDDDTEDIPNEYVPFRPKIRSISPERDYSKLSVVPYLPKRDPSKNSVADDIAFNAIVAASAERARKALERTNWGDYDQAGLVLSVEGEYKAPSSDIPLGFRYISRPITLKEPISRVVSAYDSDNSFTKYMKDLQSFREGIRSRLEEGYRALSTSYKSYMPAITASHTASVSSSHVPAVRATVRGAEAAYIPPIKPYHTRLREQEGYKYSHSLELYPVSSRSSALSLPSSAEAIPETHAIRLYDSSYEPSTKMSTLDKIQIKVNTELHSTPRSAVAARRVMQRGHSTPPDYMSKTVTQKSEVALALARAKNIIKRKPLPPASVRHPRVIVKPRYKVHRYIPARSSVSSESRMEHVSVDTVEQTRRAPLSVLAYLRYLLRNQYLTHVPKAAYRKAALLGRKVDVVTPSGRRRPKSQYAQNKLREMRKEQREYQSISPENTYGLKASRPVQHKVIPTKPYRGTEGVEKGRNLLSWKYRLDAYTNPDDLIMLPRSLNSVKQQVRDVQDKMDRHKQLMDRYLNTDTGLSVDDMRA